MTSRTTTRVSYGEMVQGLTGIVGYLDAEEQEDYYNTDPEDRHLHVYDQVLVVKQWMRQEELDRCTFSLDRTMRLVDRRIDEGLRRYQSQRSVVLAGVVLFTALFFLPELLCSAGVVECRAPQFLAASDKDD